MITKFVIKLRHCFIPFPTCLPGTPEYPSYAVNVQLPYLNLSSAHWIALQSSFPSFIYTGCVINRNGSKGNNFRNHEIFCLELQSAIQSCLTCLLNRTLSSWKEGLILMWKSWLKAVSRKHENQLWLWCLDHNLQTQTDPGNPGRGALDSWSERWCIYRTPKCRCSFIQQQITQVGLWA